MNTWMCSFSFPVVFGLFFISHWDPNRQRTLPGKSALSVLELSDVILNFGSDCQTNLAVAASLVRGAGEGRYVRLAIVQTKQPPRVFARRLNLYRGNADFSNSAP